MNERVLGWVIEVHYDHEAHDAWNRWGDDIGCDVPIPMAPTSLEDCIEKYFRYTKTSQCGEIFRGNDRIRNVYTSEVIPCEIL